VAHGWFKKRTIEVECGDETHTLTLLPSGRLRVNDHNLKMIAAFTAFGAAKPRCIEVLEAFHGKVPARLPPELAFAIMAAEGRISRAAEAALEKADYRTFTFAAVDNTPGTTIRILKVAPGTEGLKTKTSASQLLSINLYLSFPGYLEVLRYMPDGIAYTKDGKAIVVIAIRKVHRVKRRVDSLEAIVGKQGRGLAITPAEVLLKKDGEGNWIVRKWL
jgi:hypothetical protein